MSLVSSEVNYSDFGINKYDKYILKEDCHLGSKGDIGMILEIVEFSGDDRFIKGVHVDFVFMKYGYDSQELHELGEFNNLFEPAPKSTPTPWTTLLPNWGERYVCVLENWCKIPVGQEVIVIGFDGSFVVYQYTNHLDGGGLLPKEFGQYFRQTA